jgi:hypothetical protein
MKHELQHDLYIPPPIWTVMKDQGYLEAVQQETPNPWARLSIANIQATLALFVYERQQFLKGLDKS